MELNKIRNMNDKELENYLKTLSNRKKSICYKCGKLNANYTINVQNKKKLQQKKLCSFCDSCYGNLINDIGINDILWD